MPSGPLAVLDANVLFPFQLRNLLLHLAVEQLYEPLWSQEIVDECCRNLRDRLGLTPEKIAHLAEQMRRSFPESWGTGYAGRADNLTLPDEGDRHLFALALHYEADCIITRNQRHFPGELLMPLGIELLEPDSFVERLAETSTGAALRAAETHRLSLTRRPLSPDAYLVSLRERAGLPRTVDRLVAAAFLETPRPFTL